MFVCFKCDALPEGWRKHQVQTLRWRLYQTAGKVVRHAGAVILKVAAESFDLFEEVRSRYHESACQ